MDAAQKERHEEARFLSQPATPKSERRRNSWGSLLMSAQSVQGLCPLGRCLKKQSHAGACWPQDRS